MSGCLARKRWFCFSQTHISCVKGKSDWPTYPGQFLGFAEKCHKRTRFGDGIDGFRLGRAPPETRGGVSWVQGKYDRPMDPRPYLGFAEANLTFRVFLGGPTSQRILDRTSVLPRPNSLFVCPWKMRPHKVTSAVPRFCLGQTDSACAPRSD